MDWILFSGDLSAEPHGLMGMVRRLWLEDLWKNSLDVKGYGNASKSAVVVAEWDDAGAATSLRPCSWMQGCNGCGLFDIDMQKYQTVGIVRV